MNKYKNRKRNSTTAKVYTKKIINWSQYNKALVQRGDITILIDSHLNRSNPNINPSPAASTTYRGKAFNRHKPGRRFIYSDQIILLVALFRELYHLRLRQTMGLSESIFKLNHLDITAPDYTTVCRRLKHLPIPTNATNYDPREKLVVLIDSTGLKIMGEGEWTIKKHGKQYDRDWRKIHLAIDHASQDIIASYTTHGDANDVTGLEPLLKQCDKQHIAISEVIGDGAYEGPKAHAKVRKRGGRLISTPKKQSVVHNIHKVRAIPEIPKIPNVPSIPKVTRINGIARERQLANRERQRAVRKKRVEARRKQIAKYKKRQKQDIKKHKEQYDMYHDRNSYITDIKEIGVKRWKQKVNYHRRSQAETAMFRLKSNFGGCLKSKTKANQIAEVKLRINLLNTFTSLGLPKYA